MNVMEYATVAQTAAHSRTSEKYALIPTGRVLGVLADHGWHPSKVIEAATRNVDYRGFQTHIVRLRNRVVSVGEDFAEILLKNSHMGSASFELSMGWFRLICLNGLAVAEGQVEAHRVRHVGYTDEAVAVALATVLGNAERVERNVGAMKGIELTTGEQRAFAKAAIELRFDGDKWAASPDDLLTARRREDRQAGLWTVFNRVQENAVKGGMKVQAADGKRRRTRSVTGIDEGTKLNRALWTLAEEMRALKEG